MSMSRVGRVVLMVFVAALFVGVGSAQADVFMRQASHTAPMEMMGQKQPAQDDTASMWFGDGKAAWMQGENNTVLIRQDLGKMFVIDHSTKTYSEVPLDMKGMMGEADATDAEAKALADSVADMARGMMGSMDVTVTPTDETKKIKDWDARKYIVEMKMPMGSATTELWASKAIEFDYSMFQALSSSELAAMPGFDDIVEKMSTIEGFAVESATAVKMMGMTINATSELLECTEGDAPAGVYDIPEGYSKTEMKSPFGR